MFCFASDCRSGCLCGPAARLLEADLYGKSSVVFENDVYAQVGLIMLIGPAAKNASSSSDFKAKSKKRNANRGSGAGQRPSAVASDPDDCVCVHSPMRPAVGHFGIGPAPWQILGRTVIGEMLASTLIAILLIPVMFYLVEKASHRHGKGEQKVLPTEGQGALQPARFCGLFFQPS